MTAAVSIVFQPWSDCKYNCKASHGFVLQPGLQPSHGFVLQPGLQASHGFVLRPGLQASHEVVLRPGLQATAKMASYRHCRLVATRCARETAPAAANTTAQGLEPVSTAVIHLFVVIGPDTSEKMDGLETEAA